MNDPIILDLDDFCEQNNRLDLLLQLKKNFPKFKATLFTIPGLCSVPWLMDVKWTHAEWLDLVPHGWMHPHSRECESWTWQDMTSYLRYIAPLELTRGWKAPGWQISTASYGALLEQGYWVADQVYNTGRRPAKMPVYLLDSPRKVHGHIGHMGGYNANELELLLPSLYDLEEDQEFAFVRDHLCAPTLTS